jgi:uncharacterized protein (TIGR03083 family)
MNQIWKAVHAEREALVRDLETLAPEQWSTPSLCPGWSVHDVLAHLVHDAKTTRLGFVREMIVARFDFDRANARGIRRERESDPHLTLDEFHSVRHRTTSAPAPLATRLVEIIVHGEDIRRPLGIPHTYPVLDVVIALEYQVATSVKFGGGKERAHGVHLVATDGNLKAGVGEGPEVCGTSLALLLAVSGRPVGADELSGEGAISLIG